MLSVVALVPALICPAQDTTATESLDQPLNKQRLWLTGGGVAATATGSFVLLNEVWYADYARTPLHSFDDNAEWMQMDKVGHMFTSYQIGSLGYELAEWCGLKPKPASLIGGSLGLFYLSGLELLDGYSAQWGFSWGDQTANAMGTFLFSGQQFFWNEQRIRPKFSFSGNPLYKCNGEQLGNTFGEQLVKNYNAQTYWLSVNVDSFLKKKSCIPSWLNVCVGYGADGLISARGKAFEEVICNDQSYLRTRQFYFSLDADLSKIKTNSKLLGTTLRLLNVIRIPFPTVEYSVNKGWFLHPIYF
ncbi:MAG: DUF2279 domain-containing protein [Flavobacteriales bacterium]|nr:DUF2279 domain-containing protein [Flavobacteriales bacterium]